MKEISAAIRLLSLLQLPFGWRLVNAHRDDPGELGLLFQSMGGPAWIEMRLRDGGDGGWRASIRSSGDAGHHLEAMELAATHLVAHLDEQRSALGPLTLGELLHGERRSGDFEVSAQSLRRLLEPLEAGPWLGGWRVNQVAPRPGEGFTVVMAPPSGETPWHGVLTPSPSGGPPELRDYFVDGHQHGSGGVIRGIVSLAIMLEADPDRPMIWPSLPPPGEPPVLERLELDVEAFERRGYVVIPDAVSPEAVGAARQAIRWFLDLDPTLREDWYFQVPPYGAETHLQRAGTFLEFYHHQALWDLRQSPRVHGAFRALWGQDQLWVSLDRVGFRPPWRRDLDPAWRDEGCVHWDADPGEAVDHLDIQGLIALTDATEDHGTFQCAPGAHLELRDWLDKQTGETGRHPPDDAFPMESVELRAGDLLIWDHRLPHRTAANRTEEPRMVFYTRMWPVTAQNERERLDRVEAWRQRTPGSSGFEGDPLGREERLGTTAELTPLGRRLLGLEEWEAQQPDNTT